MVCPALTVDGLVVDLAKGIVLVKRKHDPFAGFWALPGGFVEVGETCEAAVVREVQEETGLLVEVVALAGVYSSPHRDPRGHTVSLVYLCVPRGGQLQSGDDAAEAGFFPSLEGVALAFDHAEILRDAGLLPPKPCPSAR